MLKQTRYNFALVLRSLIPLEDAITGIVALLH